MLLYAFIFINSLLTKHKPTETDLVPSFLLIAVQRVQVCYAGCLKEVIISVSVIGTMPTVSTHTAHFICREAQDRAKLQKTCISRDVQKDTLLEITDQTKIKSAENTVSVFLLSFF